MKHVVIKKLPLIYGIMFILHHHVEMKVNADFRD